MDIGSPPSEDLAHALYGFASVVVRAMPRDMSLTSVSVLSTLERFGPQRVTHLAGRQGVSQPSMTALVRRLEADGLVGRHTDAVDGRVVLVALSSAGAHLVVSRRQAGAEFIRGLLVALPRPQHTLLVKAAPAIAALGRQSHLDASPPPPNQGVTP